MSTANQSWPELLRFDDASSDRQGVENIEFPAELWPSDLDSFQEFVSYTDDDGWNCMYNDHGDQTGGAWYSFVENRTPADTTITSITEYFKNDHEPEQRQAPEEPRNDQEASCREPDHKGFRQGRDKPLTPIKEEWSVTFATSPVKPSSGAKLRSSLSKLNCSRFRPDPEDKVALLKESKPSNRGVTFVYQSTPDDDNLKEEEDPLARPTFPEQRNSSWMHSAKLFPEHGSGMIVSVQQLDQYCGEEGKTIREIMKHKGKDDDDDNESIESAVSDDSSGKASSLAGCTIDSKLASALSFRCTPEKKIQRRKETQSADYGRPPCRFISTGGTTKVADRRKWLLEAFNEHDTLLETASSISSATSTFSNVSSQVDKFGGPTVSAVSRRKEEWERKLAQKKKEDFRPKVTVRTQWSRGKDGSYKKRVVIQPTVE